MKGFDGSFVLKDMITRLKWTPSVIPSGCKFQMIKYNNIKLIDSLNFLPMSLSAIPHAFGLGQHVKKGHFPHRFNIQQNDNYVGPMPDLCYYGTDKMNSKVKKEVEEWWHSQNANGAIFDMKKELKSYCQNDVFILKLGCLTFRKLMIEVSKVDPFRECVTIAGACMQTYRRNFLPKDAIALIPSGGYRYKQKTSLIADQWIRWESHSRGIDIKHAGNGGEVPIGPYKVDGYYDPKDGKNPAIVFEFLGDFYHGCPKHFPDRHKVISHECNETMDMRYTNTVRKLDYLKRLGFEVVSIWECEFKSILHDRVKVKDWLSANPGHLIPQPSLRDAFFGGRTNCVRRFWESDGKEKAFYADIVSLYPFVNKWGKYIKGDPDIRIYPNCHAIDSSFDGFVCCKVLPPKSLFHPVLPARFHNKLMFVLCATCARQSDHAVECENTEKQRINWFLAGPRGQTCH
ncbi:hypothetical protein ONE63_003439 [Megalurothrips usitatus]|uniref:DNA-directed DNA polymerase n=1 Tax=Megalurothrips usitatus TaxID=439358 RepID=A0AAV7XDB7_9NEOP|nr:hypothetical protein ONE63_003439 [Megalurothrips usitatus]